MGNCEKCNHEMKIHYEIFCPKCDKEAIIMESKPIVDLHKLMYHMEANGYMEVDEFWGDWFVESHYFTNDSYIDFTLDDTFSSEESDGAFSYEELNKYMRKVAEILGLKIGDSIILWISW